MKWSLILSLLRRKTRALPAAPAGGEGEENISPDPGDPFPEPVVVEFSDVLDLHSIPPRQIRAVVEDYLEEARSRRVRWVRIIHGKGIGVQRDMVRSILGRAPYVIEYKDAPPEAGGWGATIVTLETGACNRSGS